MRKLLAISTVLALSITVFATVASIPPAAASGWTLYMRNRSIKYYMDDDLLVSISINAVWKVNDGLTQYYLMCVACDATWYAPDYIGALYLYEVGAINGRKKCPANPLGLWVDWFGYCNQYASFSLRWYPYLYINLDPGTGNPITSPGGYPALDSCYLMWHYRIQFTDAAGEYMLELDLARNILWYATYTDIWWEWYKQ